MLKYDDVRMLEQGRKNEWGMLNKALELWEAAGKEAEGLLPKVLLFSALFLNGILCLLY